MTAGRPSSYDPAYCERVRELGDTGASVVEMAVEIGCSRNTLETEWPARYPEFLEALGDARARSQVWWERKGRENLATQGFQSSMWSRSMAARFPHDWRESKTVDVNATVEHSSKEQRDAAVAAATRADR